MRLSSALLFVAALLATEPVLAEAPAEDVANDPFLDHARALALLHQLDLDAQIAERRRSINETEHPSSPAMSPAATPKPADKPPVVIELGGTGSRITATVIFPDGSRHIVSAGDTVPRWGKLQRIGVDGVEDALGRLHKIEEAGE
jgi:type IV pilus biogenesis protein PilP